MKKILPAIAGVLLGLAFLMASIPVLFHIPMGEPPAPPPPGSAAEAFNTAFGPTGYFTVVKVFELIGGLLVMIPFTRNWGLIVLCPIVVNIVTFHILLNGGFKTLPPPILIMTMAVIVLPLYLLWVERRAFTALLRRPA